MSENFGGFSEGSINVTKPTTLVVFQMPQEDITELVVNKAESWAKKKFGESVAIAVVPTGMSVKALPINGGGVYHREMLGAYEVEITAQNEEDLYARLEHVTGVKKVVPCPPYQGTNCTQTTKPLITKPGVELTPYWKQ